MVSSRGQFGFTLVELMVVVAVVAVLSMLVAPQMMGARASAELRQAARDLYTSAQWARHRAVMRGETCRLVLVEEGERRVIRIESSEDPETVAFAVLQEGPLRPVVLPVGVRFGQVMIEPTAREVSEARAVWFYPDGRADAAAVQVTGGGRVYSLLVEPNTGRSELVEGAVMQTPNSRNDLDA